MPAPIVADLRRWARSQARTMGGDDYISGPHNFWIHFVCGLVVGAGLGGWWGSLLFQASWGVLGSSVALALIMAYLSGRWGDRFWRCVLKYWF